ncbi:MAG TPA: hypothetical protein VJO12_13240, partial [Stellaceae bacterium]|nr:hypothetical protein [Stellaceae bacterium]
PEPDRAAPVSVDGDGAAGAMLARDPLARVARAALRIRHTPTGRALYRLVPASLLAALKARLPR